MDTNEQIVYHLQDIGGIATAQELKEAGFLPGSIAYALESGVIDKLTRGVYCSTDIFNDDFAAISYRWKKCIFSHASALYLDDLSDRVPSVLDVTVPHGYNPQKLTQEFPDIRIHRVNPELYKLGVVLAKSPGGATVKAYKPERAVADLIVQRKTVGADAQLVHDGITGYFKSPNADLPELSRICNALGVENEFRMYLEVLG